MDFGDFLGPVGDIIGGLIGQSTQEDIANKNIQMQQEFAQNGISWKVADAKRAGISPLYALGAPTSSFENVTGSSDLGESVSKAGQDLSAAAVRNATASSKTTFLQNKLLEGQIASQNQDVIHQMLVNSQLRRTMGAAEAKTPGGSLITPDTPGAGLPGSPYFGPVDPLPRLTQDYRDPVGGVVTLMSGPASQSAMNTASLAENAAIAPWLFSRNLFGNNRNPIEKDVKPGPGDYYYSPF